MKKYNTHNSLLPFYLADEFQLEKHKSKYNLCFSYHLDDEAQVSIVIEKLNKLIQSQAYLRQTFKLINEQLVAYIHKDLPPKILFFSSTLSDLSKLEEKLIKEQHELQLHSPIQLNIIKLTDNDSYIILFNIHHILMDGASLEQFINDLNQLIAGKPIINETANEYLAKAKSEVALQSDINFTDIKKYQQIVDEIASNTDYFDNYGKSDVVHFSQIFPQTTYQKLLKASQEHQLSVFNLLLLAWGLFVIKLSNQKQSLVNYPVNIRNDKSIAGCFINMVVLPLNPLDNSTYATMIHFLRNEMNFLKYLTKFELRNTLKLGPISSFANSNFAKPKELNIDGKLFVSKGFAQIANASISVKYRQDGDTLFFSLDILTGLFPDFISSSLLPRFFNYCNKLLNNPQQLLSNIDLTFLREKKQVLFEFNQTNQPFPQNKTIIELFEEQVQITPERTAFVYENIRFSYTELNEKANQLAHYLTNYYQVKPDDLIALLLDRNEHILITILAVLKAGGAYVPLDFSYPPERIEYILDDTQVKMILINEIHRNNLTPLLGHHYNNEYQLTLKKLDIIAVDSKKIQQELAEMDSSNIITAATSYNLAYVIYTSGTTGKPKGVMIEHKNVINTLYALNSVYKKNDADVPLKITAFTSYAFDVSVSEFLVPLLQGDELHLLSNQLRKDILLTSQYINNNQINYVYLPPVLLANLPRIKYPSLKGLIYAGEACDSATARYWASKTNLYNYYGPTETSIYATGLQIKCDEVNLIGKPIANTTTYVLNAEQNIQPIGITGELYIGGEGVAKGYLNQRELTDERFIINPFQTNKEKIKNANGRLYKTGDLVRWCADGNLEFLGRNDFQVKIRGYRIELGEIESVLINYPDIKQAVVLVKQFTDVNDSLIAHKFLVGYYVADKEIPDPNLQEYLAFHLPDYMQPSALVHLTHLPVTPNGKLDRGAFPTPDFKITSCYVAPTNDKEKLICQAFAKILGLAQVGIDDDFFKLGGNSILVISLVANLQANFNVNVMDIFHLKTPKKLARSTLFIKDNLRKNLKKILSNYQTKNDSYSDLPFQAKLDDYFKRIHQLNITSEKLTISHVLLTGATGFLGCHLLKILLAETNYSIFLIVRATSDLEAFERVNKKFEFYFDQTLQSIYNKRLFVYAGNIEKKDLGVSKETYQLLVTQIDSILHSAALTKHYGEYETFYLANVQATSYLLELSKLTKLKYFHYISTVSVLNEGYVINCNNYVFTEDDNGDILEDCLNIYVKTKYEGEKMVINYRKHGIKGSIYRVGNLAFNASNHRAQENVDENGFFTRLNCLINLQMIAPEICLEEISPVDLTAQAIVKLFDNKNLSNNIFHVFNPHLCNLGELFTQEESFKVEMITIDQFINSIINKLDDSLYNHSIELFLLHRRWLNEPHRYTTDISLLQDRTQLILKQLGFEWTPITKETVNKYLKREIERAKQSKHP